ncbi:glycosyltransferase [Vibrio cholerae]|uniref:glycosyltransferase n=2 Tax=Vibrio cholerae TaxID=666 RepID=UPI0018F0BDFA|nr:glycosyltransferase [Vibrio cholerae]MBJ6865934.1 glycosyltransferase [Vibrio cholerae]MBJ6869527.1 glycosyltransferase [Vibrio cholerae]MBJ6876957.1 glycosyltransferase [Vibrio cholerae]
MKKIIFINNLSHGGAERVVSRLFINDIIRRNVNLWTLDNKSFYRVNDCVKKNIGSRFLFLSFLSSIFHLSRLKKLDLVQAHLNYPILICGLSKILAGQFRFQAVHCFSYSSFYNKKNILVRYMHKKIMSACLKKVELHIFKSKEMISDFMNVFGWSPQNFKIIYNPYDIDEIEVLSKEKIDDSFKTQAYNIAIVGRLSPSKRPYDVIKIADELKESCHFHFFGDGSMKNELVEYIENNNIINVTFHGMIENPFKYVNKFGFYLSCSEAEGFPNALIESIISKAIPIHSDCKTGPKEILCEDFINYSPRKSNFSHEKRGIIFPVGDIEAACKAIKYAIKNRSILSFEFQENSKCFIDSINHQKITSQYAEVLECHH